MNQELREISQEIKEELNKQREYRRLSFVESKHIYYMKDQMGMIRSNFPSVSKIIKKFHEPFDAQKISFKLAGGDLVKQKEILAEWRASADLGSRTHFLLEQDLIAQYDNYKSLRQPIFECTDEMSLKSDKMFIAGKKFNDLMHERNAVLLDTEIVMGSSELGYVGQCDNAWLMKHKNQEDLCIVITDYKTNKEKNFEVSPYNGNMYEPFTEYVDFALNHYYLQIPFYGRLFMEMLKGTKFEHVKYCGGVVVHLKEDETFVEYRVPKSLNDIVFGLDLTKYL